ncbi:uncharacterized protein PHALS_11586 [Plasmopara halstedii]|uniref:Uncharacterized protein n=1 Tax=Plasmopara halstedii TaxID=4781 RepID=A0A0P1AIT7_PLAHL|nr:uncharacterized protein PHALS_11586 [Plasmopara halstedii]CEG41224.1 hypothetical protein PHALS_11586 [Plasmopara halstedii]|eukprot:XP_024577593.1 hypothetical protein PHALS_11586 [Plasmopara halstedii]
MGQKSIWYVFESTDQNVIHTRYIRPRNEVASTVRDKTFAAELLMVTLFSVPMDLFAS